MLTFVLISYRSYRFSFFSGIWIYIKFDLIETVCNYYDKTLDMGSTQIQMAKWEKQIGLNIFFLNVLSNQSWSALNISCVCLWGRPCLVVSPTWPFPAFAFHVFYL